ncbi:phosphotransferase enzyme family protein [Paenibacillus sp. FSL L8-0463]|uniref:phosphotransferase enzyme family protein n=1 Tax=Paenibacillus sp. FSL L8-0463 TaxID=2954687 RepID=UPI0040548745
MVYEAQQDSHDRILRITPSSNRSKNLILGELDWILFLANEGVSVSAPLLSRNGELVEVIEQRDGSYSCVCFEKARGRTISYPECLQNPLLYEKLGQLTGKLHALSKNYQPQDPQNQRQDWSRNWFLQNIDLIPSSQAGCGRAASNYWRPFAACPKTPIHTDLFMGTFIPETLWWMNMGKSPFLLDSPNPAISNAERIDRIYRCFPQLRRG